MENMIITNCSDYDWRASTYQFQAKDQNVTVLHKSEILIDLGTYDEKDMHPAKIMNPLLSIKEHSHSKMIITHRVQGGQLESVVWLGPVLKILYIAFSSDSLIGRFSRWYVFRIIKKAKKLQNKRCQESSRRIEKEQYELR